MNLERNQASKRRSAARRRGGRENSEGSRFERENRADARELGHQRSGAQQNGLRSMSRCVRRATAMAGMAGGALGLLHLGPHGMQVVAGRDYWEQQNEYAAESTNEDKRAPCLTPTRINRIARRNPLPPQQPGRQQQ